jgi:hypothetical protein
VNIDSWVKILTGGVGPVLFGILLLSWSAPAATMAVESNGKLPITEMQYRLIAISMALGSITIGILQFIYA